MNIIGLDIGTTSVSAAWIDTETNEVKKTYTVGNQSFIPSKNEWERIQNPAMIFDICLSLMDDIILNCPDIGVIGLTGQMHGIVYVDANGESVSPLYTWQDGRGNVAENGESLCAKLADKYGKAFYTGYGLVTHLYNLQHGLVPAKANKVCTIMDYIGMKLAGRKEPLIHTSDAASLGFYNINSNTFERYMLLNEGVDLSILPDITADIEILGRYKGIPVTVAIGDNQASFLGSIKKGREEILINMGTGGQISVYSDKIVTGDDIETRPLIGDSYLVAGSTLCGGRAYALLADFFKKCAKMMGVRPFDPYLMMNQMLHNYDNKDHLVINTAFSGTRDHPHRRGSVQNISTNNFTPEAFAYGILDGIAEEMYGRYQTIQKGGHVSHSRMVGSGNGMRKNQHLQQIFIEKFGMELELSSKTEEAACGTALAGYTAVSDVTWQSEIGV